MTSTRRGSFWKAALALATVAAVAVLVAPVPGLAGEPAASAPQTQALADWSRDLWTTAKNGRSSQALDLIGSFPGPADSPAGAELMSVVERYRGNIEKRETARQARLAELDTDLAKSSEKGDLLAALRAAIETHTLSTDKAEVLARAPIQDLVAKAEESAKTAEAEGHWLDAHNLYNRLNLLYDEAGTYEENLRRLGQRLIMLRVYVPKRLHDMRSAQRVAEGEPALPPFNEVGEDWREKLKDVEEPMVYRSIQAAAQLHVDHVPMSQMLAGGYRAVRTLAATPDLAEAFAGLGDDAARNQFLKLIDDKLAALNDPAKPIDYAAMVASVRSLLTANSATVKIPVPAVLHEFANGAMGELDDFSSIIWPDELAQFERTTEGTFKGVGIQITLNDAMEIKVVTPLEGTPAAKAGIRPNDLIRKIDGDSTLGMNLSQAVERITGKEGSRVVLTIEREAAEAPLEFDLVRAEIPIYSVKGWLRDGPRETDWDYMIDRASRIGYARITQFTNRTTREFRAAVEEMAAAGAKGMVLDLRNNPGGLLSEAVGVVSQYVPEGVVVTQEDNQGRERERQSIIPGQASMADLPVVVLVNGGSASASEIVAGCLQDYHKAVIVGDRSFGKGSVQNVFGLGSKAAFKLTTQYYRLPGKDGQPGRLIHKRPKSTTWGIEPDVEVEMLPKQFSDAIQIRLDADIVEFDAQGNLVNRENRPDPTRLITEGLDPQLETALLLIQSQALGNTVGSRAALN